MGIIRSLYFRFGKQLWSDGNTYEGNFQDDAPFGKGTYRFSNGDYFSGDFANGKFNGKLFLTFDR